MTPASAAHSFRGSYSGASSGNLASGDPSRHDMPIQCTPSSAVEPYFFGGRSRFAGAGTSNPVRRSSRQRNTHVTHRQTSGSAQAWSDHSSVSARVPSIREKERNISESSGVRGGAFYDIAIQRARAEERINRWREEQTLQGRGQQDGSTMADEVDGDGVAGGRRRNTQEGGRGGGVHQGRGGE